MPRIAHISDIHFGSSFNVDLWNKVREQIKAFSPSIIIASGDFVDSPDPLLLLAAKCELQDLAADCGVNTEFFVVPGNHDLLDLGNFWHPGSSWWFDRVMFSDTRSIRANLESGLKFKLGLNEQTRSWARFPKLNRMKPKNWFWKDKCDGRLQSCDYRKRGKRWPTISVHDQVLIACLDSNSSAIREFVFATGRVGRNQVERIDAATQLADCPCCGPTTAVADGSRHLRIAVLHHHPLPIAVRDKSGDTQIAEAKLEPFLVLKNGGDLIHELQRLKFDIVLHGHKHRPQFARVELRADNREGYPLLVLAGGSTAKRDEEPSDNTLRDIWTEQNGRLKVRTFEQGVLKHERVYREPLQDFKRRAFMRAMERTGISAEQLYSEVNIDAVGHLRSLDRTTGLRVRKEGTRLDGMVSSVTLPPHDKRLNVQLEEEGRDRVGLYWRDEADKPYELGSPGLPQEGYYWLQFNEPLKADTERPLTFGIREAAANSIAMSQWEISERSRLKGGPVTSDHGYEQVGISVSYPVDKLLLRLNLPEELNHVTPELRCRRHPASPNFPLKYLPEQRLRPGDPSYLPDPDLMEEEGRRPRFEPKTKSWVLEIDQPVSGNIYTLRWPVPDPHVESPILHRTTTFQETLAKLKSHGAIKQLCQPLFEELAQDLMDRFRSEDAPWEQQTAFLMVYHANDLYLRPVLTHSSSGSLPAGSYEVPLGGGVAGAAFLQRRILAWTSDPRSPSLIKPESSGALNSRWVLALPIFHQQNDRSGNPKLDLLPGAVIGVVTLGSNEFTSRIYECAREDATARQICQQAQELAQQCIFDILKVIREQAAGRSRPQIGPIP